MFRGFCLLIISSVAGFAQLPPVPIANVEAEMRDGSSIRMRSLELEQIKRGANKVSPRDTAKSGDDRLKTVRDDFEKIQYLQSAIVKAYTDGYKIDYHKIRESAAEMNNRATRLGRNFFESNLEIGLGNRSADDLRRPLRELIIDLDGAIGEFVTDPAFKKGVLDSRVIDRGRLRLMRIIYLSDQLLRIGDSL